MPRGWGVPATCGRGPRTGGGRRSADGPRPAAAARARACLAAVLLLASAASTGCAGILRNVTDIGPDGRSRTDARLRSMLDAGQADSALAWLRVEPDNLPGDDVLDPLYLGILSHEAGLYEESSLWLRAAYEVAEDRYSKSVLRSGLSLIANDRVLPYEPPTTERLLIHYYNAKNHLALGDLDGVAVEARRLSLLLDRYDDDSDPTPLRAGFRAFASALFAAAGEANDADVAERKARAHGVAAWWDPAPTRHPVADDAHGTGIFAPVDLLGSPVEAEPGTASPTRDGAPGTLVVVLEHGRIAQRVEHSAMLAVGGRHSGHLRGGRARRAYASMTLASQLAPEIGEDPSFLAELEAARMDAEREEAREAERAERDARRSGGGDSARARTGDREGGAGLTIRRPPDPEDDEDRAEDEDGETIDREDLEGKDPRPVLETVPGDRGQVSVPTALGDAGRRGRDRRDDDEYEPNTYLMRVAWAAYPPIRQRSGPPASLLIDGESAVGGRLPIDLSAGVVRDASADLAWTVARAIVRASAKYAVTRAVEKEAGEDNETVGRIVGAVVNAGAALLERGDTRSWALVPDRLEMVRVTLPPGTHDVTVELPDGRRLDLGGVEVASGRTDVRFAASTPRADTGKSPAL